MPFDQPVKKSGRCKWYNNDGTPIGRGCARPGCWFVHPQDPQWATAPPDQYRERGARQSNVPRHSQSGERSRQPSGGNGRGWGNDSGNTGWANSEPSVTSPWPTGGSGAEGGPTDAWGNLIASGSGGGWGALNEDDGVIDAWGNPTTSVTGDGWGESLANAWGTATEAKDKEDNSGWGSGSGWGTSTEAKDKGKQKDEDEGTGGWGSGGGWDAATKTGGTSSHTTGDRASAWGDTSGGWGDTSGSWDDSGTKAETSGQVESSNDAWRIQNAVGSTDIAGSSNINAWNQPSAAPSRLPDMVRSAPPAMKDPDRHDAASSTTRVSRSEKSKHTSANRWLPADEEPVTVEPYRIPGEESSSMDRMFVAALEVQEEVNDAKRRWEMIKLAASSSNYHNIPRQAERAIVKARREAFVHLESVQAKLKMYYDALDAFASPPETAPEPDVDLEEQEGLKYLVEQVIPWLDVQDAQLEEWEKDVAKLRGQAEQDLRILVESEGEPTTSKRVRRHSPAMEAAVETRGDRVRANIDELTRMREFLDTFVSLDLEESVTTELERLHGISKSAVEDGEIVWPAFEGARKKHQEFQRQAENLQTRLDARQDGDTKTLMRAILDAHAQLGEQQAKTLQAWQDVAAQTTTFETKLTKFTSGNDSTTAVVAQSKSQVDSHVERFVEPMINNLEQQITARIRDYHERQHFADENFTTPLLKFAQLQLGEDVDV